MSPTISIIVPVYNVECYLERCINSLINQTYKNIEIVLVDDGSTDKSGIICDGFRKQDGRVRVIHKKMGDYQMQGMWELLKVVENIFY